VIARPYGPEIRQNSARALSNPLLDTATMANSILWKRLLIWIDVDSEVAGTLA
jgi:hypothetical protein